MVLKHNFSALASYDDPISGFFILINNATSSFIFYSFLILVFVVASYVFISRTQDIGKSLLSSLHIVTVLSIILFYAGGVAGSSFISEVVFFSLLVIEAISIGGLYFMRMKN